MSRPVPTRSDPKRLWRLLGCLAVGQVVLTFGGAALDHGSAELGASRSDLVQHFVTYSMAAKFAGSYLEFLGSLALLGAALLLARLVDGTGVVSGTLTSGIAAAATLTVAAMSTAVATQSAAVYGAHHGSPLATVAMLNDVGDLAFYLSIGLLGVAIICLCASALASRALPAVLGYGGVLIGAMCVLSPLGVRLGLQQGAFLLQTAWWLALGVFALRRPTASTAGVAAREISTV